MYYEQPFFKTPAYNIGHLIEYNYSKYKNYQEPQNEKTDTEENGKRGKWKVEKEKNGKRRNMEIKRPTQ